MFQNLYAIPVYKTKLLEHEKVQDDFAEILEQDEHFKNVDTYNEKAIEKFITSDQLLIDLKDKINDLESWDESSLDNLLLQYREEHELSVPKVNQPIRIALTGSTNSPSLGLTLYLFNKKEVLKRLDQLIKHLHTKN